MAGIAMIQLMGRRVIPLKNIMQVLTYSAQRFSVKARPGPIRPDNKILSAQNSHIRERKAKHCQDFDRIVSSSTAMSGISSGFPLFDSTLSNVFRQLNTQNLVTRPHVVVRRELLLLPGRRPGSIPWGVGSQ